MCVHHHHVLIPAKLGQSLSVVVRMHALLLTTSRHGPSLQIQCFSFRMSHVSNMRVHITSNHHAASRRCGMHHLVCPIIQLVCRPVSEWWRIEPNPQEVPTSTFLPSCTSPALYANLWRGHFADLPGFAHVQFDCNNETCMSICPSSHPVLEKSVSSQHCESPENNEYVVVWYRSGKSRGLSEERTGSLPVCILAAYSP